MLLATQVKPEDVMLGADGDAEDRSGADASTSGAPSDFRQAKSQPEGRV